MLEPLGERTRVLGGGRKEVLDAPLGVIGQRIHAREVLLRACDAERRLALGEGPRPAHGGDDQLRFGRYERRRQQPGGGEADRQVERVIHLHGAADQVAQRLTPDVEDDVRAHQRVAERARLLEVETLGLLAVLGFGEVEVAGNAQQLASGDRRARAAGAARHIGLERPQVAPAVKDHGDRLGQRQTADLQRHSDRGGVVEQRPPEQLLGGALLGSGIFVQHRFCPGRSAS
jgi:hypothetical protein